MNPYRQFSIRVILTLITSFAVAATGIQLLGPENVHIVEKLFVISCLGISIFIPIDAVMNQIAQSQPANDVENASTSDFRDVVFVWTLTTGIVLIWLACRSM